MSSRSGVETMRNLLPCTVLSLALVLAVSGCGDDAPAPGDSGTDADSGGTDAGPGDAGPVGCPSDFARCTTYMDLTGMTAVSIAADPSLVYTPKCVRVGAGTTVTIGADMLHPIKAAPCSPP